MAILISKRFTELGISGWEARENEYGADLGKKDIPADLGWYGGFHAGHLCRSLMDDRRDLGAYHRLTADALCSCLDVSSDSCFQ